MNAAVADVQLPLFFITGVSHDERQLTVRIGNMSGPIGAFVFDRAVSFWFFMESDHHDLLSRYDGTPLVTTSEQGIGLLRLKRSRLLEAYNPNGRDAAEAHAYLVATPQEYVEVICFAVPAFNKD